jgi:hypothetical protein
VASNRRRRDSLRSFSTRPPEKSLVVLLFESDDDYRRGDETLSAMPTEDTPGQRTSVTKYDVAIRMAD